MASSDSWPTPGSAGVDGLIVVDLPPEEDTELCLPALKAGFNFIRLATPTTDDKRLPTVLTNTSGFVYYVSITGITGSAAPDTAQSRGGGRAHQAPHQAPGLRRLRRAHRRAGRVRIARGADGVVVGSALVEAVRAQPRRRRQGYRRKPRRRSAGLVRALADGVRRRASRPLPRTSASIPL